MTNVLNMNVITGIWYLHMLVSIPRGRGRTQVTYLHMLVSIPRGRGRTQVSYLHMLVSIPRGVGRTQVTYLHMLVSIPRGVGRTQERYTCKEGSNIEQDHRVKFKCNNGNLVPTYVGKYTPGREEVENKKYTCVKGGSNVERDQCIDYKYS